MTKLARALTDDDLLQKFKCEVCKITMKSAQKLMDHVNYSVLHKSSLEGEWGESLSLSRINIGKGGRRLIFDGTKLFWRINETLELCIYEDAGRNAVTVNAYFLDKGDIILPVRIQLRSLLKAMGRPIEADAQCPADIIANFLLPRLNAIRKDDCNSIALEINKLTFDELELKYLPILQENETTYGVPNDLIIRRRHSIDDVYVCQKELESAAKELKIARMEAEAHSKMAHAVIEAFNSNKSTQNDHKPTDWLYSFERVKFRNQVQRSKTVLEDFG